MDISEIRDNMEHVTIEGMIINFDRHVIVIDDKSGRTFVRYNRRGRMREAWQKMLEQIKIGNRIRVQDCYSVNYSGILQLKMNSKSFITTLQVASVERQAK